MIKTPNKFTLIKDVINKLMDKLDTGHTQHSDRWEMDSILKAMKHSHPFDSWIQ